MESWFADAKRIKSLEAEICFLLHDEFCNGLKIERRVPSMLRSAEVVGHEEELANYYREVIRVARKHHKAFNEIRQYFWMRFWLWNTDEEIYISFPWYDTYSEINQFLTSLSDKSDGQLFWDVDQGWELDVHAFDGDFIARLRNPDDNETHAIVRLPIDELLSSIQPLRTRTDSIIKTLTSVVGRDLWTNHVEWPEFCPPKIPVSPASQPWWHLWKGRAKP